MILDPIDQRIRDQGFNFVPFNRFLASPFQAPTGEEAEGNVAPGIPAIYQARSSGGRDDGGSYAASLGLGPDTRGYMGNFQDINPSEMYSYTPQGITIEDLSKPSNIGDFQITTAPDLPNQSGYIKPAPEIFEPQRPNIFSKGFDLAKTVGSGIMSAATGIPFAGPIIEKGLGAIASQFEDRPLGAAVIDEFGNVYSEDELNASNALGGYYSGPARSARRRTARIQNMLERQRLGKKYSLANLQRLQEQEKAQEEIQKAAARAMQDRNRAEGRGGYQAGYSDDFMEGPSGRESFSGDTDLSATMGSSKDGGIIGYGGKSGTPRYQQFMDGGLADLVDIYD